MPTDHLSLLEAHQIVAGAAAALLELAPLLVDRKGDPRITEAIVAATTILRVATDLRRETPADAFLRGLQLDDDDAR